MLKSLSSRAIMGEFARALEDAPLSPWVSELSVYFPKSDQFTEEHRWVGSAPGMTQWVGSRQVKQLQDYGLKIQNVGYESTLEVTADEIAYDKTAQVQMRIEDQASAAAQHWEELLTPLISAGASTVCYDGQFYFSSSHPVGGGVASNSISTSLGAIANRIGGNTFAGSVTSPGAEAMVVGILNTVKQFYKFKDDQGRPINGSAKRFILMTGVDNMDSAAEALAASKLGTGKDNPIDSMKLDIQLAVNPRLNWNDKFALFRADGAGGLKPFIRQQMGQMEYTTEDKLHRERKYEYGLFSNRGVGLGLWQTACLHTFVA
jgi:phage major head subunit gpT-like protein